MGVFDVDFGNVARIPTIVKPPRSSTSGGGGGYGTEKIGGRGIGYWHIVSSAERTAFINGKKPTGSQVFRIFPLSTHLWGQS